MKRVVSIVLMGIVFLTILSNSSIINAAETSGFTEQTAISETADGATSVYTADLDNDGYTDVISSSSHDNTVVWYKNNGDSTFTEQTAITTTADEAKEVYAADLDNDGDIDVLSANFGNHTIAWYMNNGDGTFTEQPAISITAKGAYSVYAEDLDNDGDMDVLSANFYESTISWYKNNGDATFTEQTAISTTAIYTQSVYAEDLDNDGDMDVLSANSGNDTITYYMNNGDSTFTEQTAISTTADYPTDISAADLDNDGNMDVLSASYQDHTIGWYKNNGDGTFTEQIAISTTANYATGAFAADFDNDGDMDVVSSNAGNTWGGIAWYMNNGDSTFTEQTDISKETGGDSVCAADLDNDGDMDVLTVFSKTDTVIWYENNITSSEPTITFEENGGSQISSYDLVKEEGFTEQIALSTTANEVFFVYAADLDNDGDMDVLSASYGDDTIAWYKNNGDSTFTEQAALSTTANGAREVYAADLDNDGDMDVLSASDVDDTIAWYMNNGDGTFTEQAEISTSADGAQSVYAADLDNDGDMDVLSASYGDDTIAWYMNNGDGTFTEQAEISTTADWAFSVYAADLDNDGDMDVLSASFGDDTIAWYKNNSDGTFTEQTHISTTADRAWSVYAADLDNDGDMDVLSAGYDDNTIAWYENNGDSTFTEQLDISTTANGAASVYAADLDNDGDMDILSASYNDDTVAWYKNNGDSTFTEQLEISTTANGAYCVFAADLDNDGDMDILSANREDNEIKWYKNNDGSVGSYKITAPTNPTKTGYVFNGWYTNIALTTSFDFNTEFSGNLILYAKWSINQYKVKYVDYDGTALQTTVFDYEADLSGVTATEPTRTGYTFNSWDTIVPTNMPANDLIITATYIINEYTVEYVDHDGSVLQTTICDYNDDLSGFTTPSEPTRTGYSFDTWDITVPTTMPENDITVTATYTINEYTVEYVDHDGFVLQTAIFDYNSDLSGVTAPTEPTRTGYTFTAWDTTVPTNMPENDITVTAVYLINQYTLKYIDYDGKVLQTTIFDYNSDLSGVTATEPTRTGYTFDSWDTIVPANMPVSDLTITATYTINEYTVEYVDHDGSILQTAIFDYNSDLSGVTAPTEPTKTGYTFSVWNRIIPANMPASDITVTAIYTINEYTVEYVDHDGAVLQTAIFDYNSDLSGVTSPTGPTRTGYTFTSWDISVPANMPASDITVTAIYTINKYTVEYVDHDGAVLQTANYDYNANLNEVTAPTDPTRTGYTFTAWDISVPANMPASDQTITATYTINEYTVEYVNYDGTVLQTANYNYNSDLSGVIAPTNLIRDEYVFNGWNNTLPTVMPANDVTLTAQWKQEVVISINVDVSTVEGLDEAVNPLDYEDETYEVELDIEIIESTEVTIEDQTLIDDKLENKEVAIFIDISLYVVTHQDGNSIRNLLTEANKAITITINIPSDQQGYDDYRILRIHNGVAEYLDTEYDEENQTLTFETSQFSTYSIVYQDSGSGLWWLLLLILIPTGYFGYIYKKEIILFIKDKTVKVKLLIKK